MIFARNSVQSINLLFVIFFMKQRHISILLFIASSLLLGVGCGSSTPEPPPRPVSDTNPQAAVTLKATVKAANHETQNGTVVIDEVDVSGPAWAVLYSDAGKRPGTVITSTKLQKGKNEKVPLESGQVTLGEHSFFILIHEDAGIQGQFEFPQTDLPASDLKAVAITITNIAPADDENPVSCTSDARDCADGSVVGATPTSCGYAPCPEDTAPEQISQTKEFSMVARQWEFSPSTITVNKGDHVTLSITSEDVTHGFSLNAFGINEQLQPGKTTIVEFDADTVGTHSFFCSVFCGSGHGGMSGTLIVK